MLKIAPFWFKVVSCNFFTLRLTQSECQKHSKKICYRKKYVEMDLINLVYKIQPNKFFIYTFSIWMIIYYIKMLTTVFFEKCIELIITYLPCQYYSVKEIFDYNLSLQSKKRVLWLSQKRSLKSKEKRSK